MATSDLQYVTVAEAAKRLAVSRVSVYRRVWTGELPATKIGSSVRIRVAALERWLADHEQDGFATTTQGGGGL